MLYLPRVEVLMAAREPTVAVTNDALIIRIPWGALDVGNLSAPRRAKRRLTAQDVVECVEAGRLAHRLGKTRTVRSLKALAS